MTATTPQRRKPPVRPTAPATIDAAGFPHRAPAPIAERILDCFPSGSYALSALLRLLDIVETDAVPTAAVECRVQPRLLINPCFVATHAATPEKLLMLVMHELHHVLLGHTTLFPTITPAQNIVFDAVINGLISRMFPHQSFLSFLTDFYPAGSFPSCLLRPPPGWPGKPRIAPGVDALPAGVRQWADEVHLSLYSEGGATYDEVASVLPRLLVGTNTQDVPLLGGHDESSATMGGLEHRSPVLFDIVRDIVERWPQPPNPIRGRSLSELLKVTRISHTPPASGRSVLRGLIRKVANLGAFGDFRRPALDTATVPIPLPVLSRRTTILQALGQRPLLFDGPVPWPRHIHSGERVHVYLDVSGSMDALKGALYGAILDCKSHVQRPIHLFSTKVADISLGELRQGVCKSTGGTNITCVATHMQSNRIRRALIVTDGWVGKPRGSHLETLSRVHLAVAFLGPTINATNLAKVANFTAHLSIGA